jgi:N-acetylglucosamine kinase-like BadF-type ATPase
LAFAAAEDPVARAILTEAADALADLLAAVREPGLDGPVVLGGSVLVRGFLAGPAELRDRLQLPPEAVTASDGVVGAAVLALRDAGIVVDQNLFDRIRRQLADIVKDRAP